MREAMKKELQEGLRPVPCRIVRRIRARQLRAKTINVPKTTSFEEFSHLYETAYDLGLKGCTTFRSNPVTGAVLSERNGGVEAPHCCVAEREAD